MSSASLISILLVASVPFGDLPPPPYVADHPFLGSWVWTRAVNDCTEFSQYRRDGTSEFISGTTRGESRFRIARRPDLNGFYTVTDETTSTTAGRDCTDSGEPTPVGDVATFYPYFLSRDRMLICYERSLDRCFGPLDRVEEKRL